MYPRTRAPAYQRVCTRLPARPRDLDRGRGKKIPTKFYIIPLLILQPDLKYGHIIVSLSGHSSVMPLAPAHSPCLHPPHRVSWWGRLQSATTF